METLKTADQIAYAELHCKTNFSFLRGASHADELVRTGAKLGLAALAITDHQTLAGVVRAHTATREHKLKLLIGAELHPLDAPSLVVWATDRAAYGRLCKLLTVGNFRASKGECSLQFEHVAEYSEGLLAGVLLRPMVEDPQSDADDERRRYDWLAKYREVFGDRLYAVAEVSHGPDDEKLLERMSLLAKRGRTPMVAANDVHYHAASRRLLQDVLTAVRLKTTVADAIGHLFPNAERRLLPPAVMRSRFAARPDAIARTLEVADRCTFSLDELRYEYPKEVCPEGMSPPQYLASLVHDGAKGRYPGGVPDKVQAQIESELSLIAELEYEPYFLTVWDVVRFARSRNILCQGRGSAANSVVCFCLGVTAVDPTRVQLLFGRFISRERHEAPDIDIDFEHERREEVLQYLYEKYGRRHAGMTAEVICYRPRSAVRDVGKALGLSLDRVDRLAKALGHWGSTEPLEDRCREAGLDPETPTAQRLLYLVNELLSFPRHLSQHVGGMVLTQLPLDETVPIEKAAMEDRTVIQWNKDDLDDLGILKVDCLGLGMLTAIRKCFDLVEGATGKKWELATIPADDRPTYDMIQKADTIGVFQIESRAQMSMLPRLKPDCYYDLVIEVAIVRPGPIQGKMVHPYLKRRMNREKIEYPLPELAEVLDRTLGVPLFQEQAMKLAVVAAGFSDGEADQLRRAMAAWRRPGLIDSYRIKLLEGMRKKGLPEDFASRVFEQIRGFGEYGFPESHAASFALLVYASAWLKCYYPAAFTAAILNSLPMGFYAPAQLVADARRHGVEVLPPDVNFSDWDCTLEGEGRVVRLTQVEEGDGAAAVQQNSHSTLSLVPSSGSLPPFSDPLPPCGGGLGWGVGNPSSAREVHEVAAVGGQPDIAHKPNTADEVADADAAETQGTPAKCVPPTLTLPHKGGGDENVEEELGWGVRNPSGTREVDKAAAVGVHREIAQSSLPMDRNAVADAAKTQGTPAECVPPTLTLPHKGGGNRKKGGGETLKGEGNKEGEADKKDGDNPTASAAASRYDANNFTRFIPSPNRIPQFQLRLGLRQIHGIPRNVVDEIVAKRGEGRYQSVGALARRAGLERSRLLLLARADALGSLGLNRRQALWQAAAWHKPKERQALLFEDLDPVEPSVELPDQPPLDAVLVDYGMVGLSLKAHPVQFLREALNRRQVVPSEGLPRVPNGKWVRVAGVVLVRQQPGTAKGIRFMTLEDETGIVNLIVKPPVYQRDRYASRSAPIILAEGPLQSVDGVIHVLAARLEDVSPLLAGLRSQSRDFR